jgi:nitrate/nitrite transporter NarK
MDARHETALSAPAGRRATSCSRTPCPGQIGKVFGFVSAGLPLGSAMTPVPFGFLIDHGRAELVLIAAAGFLLASILCMGRARASAKREAIAVAAE